VQHTTMDAEDLEDMEFGEEDGVQEFSESATKLKLQAFANSVSGAWGSIPKAGRIALVAVVLVAVLLCTAGASLGAGFAWGSANEYNKYEGGDYVFRYSWEYSFDRSDPSEALIQETNEYQVKLHSFRFNTTEKRDDEVAKLLDVVGRLMDVDLSKRKQFTETLAIYNETQYDPKGCGYDYSELRTRDYWVGPKTNSSTMSINVNSGKDKTMAATFPLAPNASILEDDDDSEQKLEQDVHACFHKYNRKTKLKNLPMGYTIDSCGQLHESFPDAPGLGDVDPHTRVNTTETSIWVWEYMLDGTWWYDTTKFKLLFTLYYDSLEEATTGEGDGPSGDSEFSMRFYSQGKGMADFEHDILVAIGQVYLGILEDYGDRKYPCDD